MATKKAGGSTKNGRDSHGQRRGVKCFSGEIVSGGSILVRQCGTRIHAAEHVGVGRDWTLFAKQAGTVEYFERAGRRWVRVVTGTS